MNNILIFIIKQYYILLFLVLSTELDVQPNTVQGVWTTFAGGPSSLSSAGSTAGTYPSAQGVSSLFDDNTASLYSNRGNSSGGTNAIAGLNTGFYVTIAQCQPVLTGFSFGYTSANPEREPLTVTVEGTNCANLPACISWTLLYNGSSGLDISPTNATYGVLETVSNTVSYQTYRFLVLTKRALSPYVSYSDVEFFGYSTQTTATKTAGMFKCFYFYSVVERYRCLFLMREVNFEKNWKN